MTVIKIQGYRLFHLKTLKFFSETFLSAGLIFGIFGWHIYNRTLCIHIVYAHVFLDRTEGKTNLARAPLDAAGTILLIRKKIAYSGMLSNISPTSGDCVFPRRELLLRADSLHLKPLHQQNKFTRRFA